MSLRVYDVPGRIVRTLVDAEVVAGSRAVVWDGRDTRGQHVGSGVFFYQLDAPGYASAKKLIILK